MFLSFTPKLFFVIQKMEKLRHAFKNAHIYVHQTSMDCSLILTFLKMYFVTEEKKTGEASLEVFYRFLFNGQKIVLQMVHE